ncbi:MAG: aspartate carbamoyltransferase catalytic subunit [Candidatus Kapaibacteriota bacterium]
MKSLLDISSLSKNEVLNIFEQANTYQRSKRDTILTGKNILIAFFESSTRTRISFELAVRRLGGTSIIFNAQESSIAKGESFVDTIHTLQQYEVHGWIIRHVQALSPHLVQQETRSLIVNAGDGSHQHPTQALIDAYTLFRKWGSLEGKNILIVGDILHSRVARSNMQLFTKLGSKVYVTGPGTLLSSSLKHITVVPTIHNQLDNMDAVIMLRMQQERMKKGLIPSESEYAKYFGMNEKLLQKHNNLLVLHPGPANYGIELSMECMNYPNVLIREQVKNGLFIRMAVLKECMT